MDAYKAEGALRACLRVMETSPQPAEDVDRHLDHVARDPQWSSQEIMELQMLIIQALVHRWRGPDAK